MLAMFSIHRAARVLRAGGVIAYPTEGVFGLGCLPERGDAVAEILQIKRRSADKGLLLIAADEAQLAPWVDFAKLTVPAQDQLLGRGRDDVEALPAASGQQPVTWIVPAAADAPDWLTGGRHTIAVRLTAFPLAAALCNAVESALVSTSANVSGHPPTRNVRVLRRQFHDLVDYVVPGACGSASGPSEIRNLVTGETVRAAVK